MVDLLDCTLRDGSYVVDFAFTETDTAVFTSEISKLSIPYIEVGHGIGLGASRCGFGDAGASDADYIRIAKDNCGGKQIGVFAIPGVAQLDDVRIARDNGSDFIRIGSDVNRVPYSKEFIELAKSLGMYVFSNIMKSYTVSAYDFGILAKECIDYGSDCLYIVDSSGSMSNYEISIYAAQVRKQVGDSVSLGFHGHNNLGMAVANALWCIGIEFDVIDVTLHGIGRGGGNVPTEQLMAAMLNKSSVTHDELIEVMDIGDRLVSPISGYLPHRQLDIISGAVGFHSSYMPLIMRAAKQYNIDPRVLIVEVSRIERVTLDQNIVFDIASKLKSGVSSRLFSNKYYGEEYKC